MCALSISTNTDTSLTKITIYVEIAFVLAMVMK